VGILVITLDLQVFWNGKYLADIMADLNEITHLNYKKEPHFNIKIG
jgi:hypothetical protein